jgi:hypothetical protein
MKFLITDQSIGEIAERQLDDPLVSDQLPAMFRLSQLRIPAQGATGKMVEEVEATRLGVERIQSC